MFREKSLEVLLALTMVYAIVFTIIKAFNPRFWWQQARKVDMKHATQHVTHIPS